MFICKLPDGRVVVADKTKALAGFEGYGFTDGQEL